MTFLPPRIESAPAMLLAGLRREHAMATVDASVPEQWREFRSTKLGAGDRLPYYGAICGATPGSFEYLTGVEVDSFDGLAEGIGRIRVPAQQYAVFAHSGPVSAIGALWQHIWRDWLPQASYEDAETPGFERYDHRYDEAAGEGEFEIWFPIREKRSAS